MSEIGIQQTTLFAYLNQYKQQTTMSKNKNKMVWRHHTDEASEKIKHKQLS